MHTTVLLYAGDGFGGGGIVDAIQGVMSQLREVSRKEEANSGLDIN